MTFCDACGLEISECKCTGPRGIVKLLKSPMDGIKEMHEWENKLGKRNPFKQEDYDELVKEGFFDGSPQQTRTEEEK